MSRYGWVDPPPKADTDYTKMPMPSPYDVPRFTVGDRVRHRYGGFVGTIRNRHHIWTGRCEMPGGYWWIRWEGGFDGFAWEGDLELSAVSDASVAA